MGLFTNHIIGTNWRCLVDTVAKMSTGPYNYSYIFKYIIIGDMGVGKSCLLHQFTEKKCKILPVACCLFSIKLVNIFANKSIFQSWLIVPIPLEWSLEHE